MGRCWRSMGRRWRSIVGLVLAASVVFFLTSRPSATQDIEEARTAPFSLVVTIAQIAEPLRDILGGRWRVEALMGAGIDPHLYRPTRSDISALIRADMVIWVGPELEAQIARPVARLDRPARVVALLDHLPEGDLLYPHSGSMSRDPHVWMDPLLWGEALKVAVERIAQRDPAHAGEYRARLTKYRDRLRRMDRWIASSVTSIPSGQNVMITAHDAFTYFGRRYGIELLALQGLTTESEAGLHRIERMAAIAADQSIPAVFSESSVGTRHVHALIEGCAARGHRLRLGQTLYSDAMGDPEEAAGTYLGMMEHNTRAIVSALGGRAFFPDSLATRRSDR